MSFISLECSPITFLKLLLSRNEIETKIFEVMSNEVALEKTDFVFSITPKLWIWGKITRKNKTHPHIVLKFATSDTYDLDKVFETLKMYFANKNLIVEFWDLRINHWRATYY